jgi:hypothetical protein
VHLETGSEYNTQRVSKYVKAGHTTRSHVETTTERPAIETQRVKEVSISNEGAEATGMSRRGSQAIKHLDRKVSAVERMFAPSCIKPCFFYTHGRASRHRDGNTLSAASKTRSLVHKELFHLGPVPVIFTIHTFGSCHVALSQTRMRTRETKGWNDAACMGGGGTSLGRMQRLAGK